MTPLGDSVCGLDESGRGALAGPIVIAAVTFPEGFSLARAARGLVVRDSKLLSANQRSALHSRILATASCIDAEVIAVTDIDERGINWANTEGFRRLVRRSSAGRYIVDGRWDLGDLGYKASRVICQVHADEVVPAALAAGVVAKVYRDRIMRGLDERWPMYGWARNTGHGTAEHVKAIRRFGISPEHRAQFVATALRARRQGTGRATSPKRMR